MPMMLMPDGSYVEVAEGTKPEVIARIRAQFPAKAAKTTSTATQQPANKPPGPAINERGLDVDRRASRYRAADDVASYMPFSTGKTGNELRNSISFGLADKGRAAVDAAFGALSGKNFDDEYQRNKQALAQNSEQNYEESPVSSWVNNIAGAFLNPLGAETGAARVASRFAKPIFDALKASKAGVLASKLGSSSVGLGARAGFNQGVIEGGLNQIDNPESTWGDVGTNAFNGGISGGLAGGAFGGIFGAAGKIRNVLKDRAPEHASRVAYSKVADGLDRSVNPNTGNAYSPLGAINEIKVTDAGGGDAMLMDISPEFRNMSAYLGSRPGMRLANELEQRVQGRTEAAPDRFDTRIKRVLNTSPDAHTRRKELTSARKVISSEGYKEDGVMDKPINWTPDMDKFFREATPVTQKALRDAYELRLNLREMPAQQLTTEGTFTHIPDLRTFDYVKRVFDNDIGEAMRAGGNGSTRAMVLSKELRALKDMLAKDNPEYMKMLSQQRDLYEQQKSLDLGTSFIKRMRVDSRTLLDDMRKEGVDREQMRLGVADALMHMREGSDNPVVAMRKMLRSADQRQVLQYVFGSNKTISEFEKFMRREMRSTRTDRMVDPSVNSKTHVLNAQGEADDVNASALIGKSALQGLAFGGSAGMASRVLRAMDTLSSGLGPKAQEELARILMSKGEGLQKGIRSAEKYAQRREAVRKSRAVAAGKVGAAAFGGLPSQ